MCGGGSSPSGQTKYEWNPAMERYWNGNTADPIGILQRAWNQSNEAFQHYGDDIGEDRYADLNADQKEAHGYTSGMARLNSSPVTYNAQTGKFGGVLNETRDQIEKTVKGDYLLDNPYASGIAQNPYGGKASNAYEAQTNAVVGQDTQTQRNAFAGDNPYFRDTLLQGMGDITDQYQKGTAADTTRMFNLAGAFGGSAHQNKMANNEAALGKSLGSYADQMLNRQYDRSAGLENDFLSRDLQNQQYNKGIEGQYNESAINRGYNSDADRLQRGFNDWTNEQNRGMTAYEGERNRMMGALGAGQNEQGLAYQRIAGVNDMGNFLQQNSQKDLDFGYQQFQDKANYNYKNLDWLSSILGRAQGGTGPTATMYSNSSSQYAPWLGAAMAGASFFPS
jgi:hypothetical protein